MRLQHKDGENCRFNKVTVQYDGRTQNLEVSEDGVVEVGNQVQADELLETHGEFEVLDGDTDDLPDHVLADKNVGEAQSYIQGIGDEERLKELRQKDDRKTVKQAVDDRLQELREPEEQPEQEDNQEEEQQEDNQEQEEPENQDNDEEEPEDDEVSNEDEEQDGEETENQ